MISLVVGVARRNLTHWHGNVQTEDPGDAATRARAMAAAAGIDLVIAALRGPPHAAVPHAATPLRRTRPVLPEFPPPPPCSCGLAASGRRASSPRAPPARAGSVAIWG